MQSKTKTDSLSAVIKPFKRNHNNTFMYRYHVYLYIYICCEIYVNMYVGTASLQFVDDPLS